MPGTSRSITSRVASGVTSRGARPVPPVVITKDASAAASRMRAAMKGRESGTTTGSPTVKPASRRMRQASGPDSSARTPRAAESLTVITTPWISFDMGCR